jgi:AraC-like DNA-binding protein
VAPSFRFLHFNHLPKCTAWVDEIYDGYFALNYAHAGRISWGVNGGEPRELAAQVAWWTWPGPRFTYGCENPPGWDHYYVTFSGRWAEELFRTGWLPTVAEESFRPIANPEDFCLKMTRLQAALAKRDDARAWAMLLGLLLDVRDSRTEPTSREQRLLNFASAIRREPERVWTEESGMRICAVSKPHFRRLFRHETGLPFRQFCLQARMDLAASLLRSGGHSIQEVASSCGLADIYQFYRQFRKHHKLPPGEYQRTLRLEQS